tara:strand:- start:175 stop:672 length:498 start_codon:yes stop_codon:yes gene_type:complete
MKNYIGIIFYKIENNKTFFLLKQNNLVILNQDSDIYSDFGLNTENIDDVINLFVDNTFNLSYDYNEIINMPKKYFKNEKYNYSIYFINSDIDKDKIYTINKLINYFNKNFLLEDNKFIKYKKENYISQDSIKWFELNEILNNQNKFSKFFFNTFLKSIKEKIIII